VHQAFLNAGGLGILVGDGQLPNPGSEKIIEMYYGFPVFSWRVTFDYQFVARRGARHVTQAVAVARVSAQSWSWQAL
jgi:hypothetical protein